MLKVLLVVARAVNQQKDIVFDGTMTWAPFVKQTLAMVRDHRHNYRRGPGYTADNAGHTVELCAILCGLAFCAELTLAARLWRRHELAPGCYRIYISLLLVLPQRGMTKHFVLLSCLRLAMGNIHIEQEMHACTALCCMLNDSMLPQLPTAQLPKLLHTHIGKRIQGTWCFCYSARQLRIGRACQVLGGG